MSMSTSLVSTSSTSTASSYPPEDQSLALGNLMMAMVQSNVPVNEAIEKSSLAFSKFAEEMRNNFQILVQENTSLKKQLAESESRYKEAETIHQAERNASDEKVKELLAAIKTLSEKVDTHETQMKNQFNAEINAVKNQVATLNSQLTTLSNQLTTLNTTLTNSNHKHQTSITSLTTTTATLNTALTTLKTAYSKHTHNTTPANLVSKGPN